MFGTKEYRIAYTYTTVFILQTRQCEWLPWHIHICIYFTDQAKLNCCERIYIQCVYYTEQTKLNGCRVLYPHMYLFYRPDTVERLPWHIHMCIYFTDQTKLNGCRGIYTERSTTKGCRFFRRRCVGGSNIQFEFCSRNTVYNAVTDTCDQ